MCILCQSVKICKLDHGTPKLLFSGATSDLKNGLDVKLHVSVFSVTHHLPYPYLLISTCSFSFFVTEHTSQVIIVHWD